MGVRQARGSPYRCKIADMRTRIDGGILVGGVYYPQLIAVHSASFLCSVGWCRRARNRQLAALCAQSPRTNDNLYDRLNPADQGMKPHPPLPKGKAGAKFHAQSKADRSVPLNWTNALGFFACPDQNRHKLVI